MSGCPTLELLQDFVRDGEIADDLYEHIENCQACGRIIEELCSSTESADASATSSQSLGTARPEDLEFLQQLAARPPRDEADEDAPHVVFPGASTDTLGQLDCYRIQRRIDGGGFGEVFEAWDCQVQRPVALKVIRVAGFDRTSLQRFQREAQAAGAVEHDNVVVLHRVMEPSDTFPYACLVMEYVRGGSLRRRIEKEERIDIRLAVQWMIQAALGLEAVHAQGLLHRDIKPANLLIDETGKLKVGDFGLARPLAAQTQASVHIAGTPPYMGPEQLQTPENLTIQSDIFGLGVVLYQLLTGVRPFQGKDEVLRKQIIEGTPPSIRQLNQRVSRDLETVCLRCLHKDPTRRFESARAFAEDLENCLAGRPIKSRPIGAVEKAYWWVRTHPTLTTVLVGLVCVSVAAVLVAWKFEELSVKESVARQQAVDNAELTEQSRSQVVESLQLMVDQLNDQIGDPSRLVPLYLNAVDRLKSLSVVSDDLQGRRRKTAAESHLRLAMLYDRMAPTIKSEDISEKAAKHFEAAIAIYESMGEVEVSKLISAYDGLGGNYLQRGQLDQAEVNFKRTLELCDAQLRKQPNDPALLRSRSIIFESMSVVATRRGNDAERLKNVQECLRLREQLVQLSPSDPANQELANVLVLVGDAVRYQNPDQVQGYAKAAEYYVRAIKIAETLVEHDPSKVAYNRSLANALDRMGLCVAREEKPKWSQRALALREKINRIDPQGRVSVNDLLVSYLGVIGQTQDPEEAKRLMGLASEFAERWISLAPNDPQAINLSARLALQFCAWHDKQAELKPALKYAQRAVELRRHGLKLSPSAASRRSMVVALKSLGDIQLGLDPSSDIALIVDEQISILKQMIEAHENEAEMREWLEELQQLK